MSSKDKKYLCKNAEPFVKINEAEKYLYNNLDSEDRNCLTIYIAGFSDYRLPYLKGYSFDNISVIGLTANDSIRMDHILITSSFSLKNLEVFLGEDILSISTYTQYENCKIRNSRILIYENVVTDLNTLNSISYLQTDLQFALTISMKGNLTTTPFICTSAPINFIDIPNNTEFVQLSYKLVARNIFNKQKFMTITSDYADKVFVFPPYSKATYTSIAMHQTCFNKLITVIGDSVSLEIKGNQWHTVLLNCTELINSKLFLNCSLAPNITISNESELHIMKNTKISYLQTNSIFSDFSISLLSIDELSVINSSQFYIKGSQMEYLNISCLNVEPYEYSLSFVSDSSVPIFYPKEIKGISKISMKYVLFERETKLKMPIFLCEFENTTDVDYEFVCNEMEVGKYEIFKTNFENFSYKFILTIPTRLNITSSNINGTISVEALKKKYPNRFCNEKEEADCYLLADIDEYVDYGKTYLQLIAESQEMIVPPLSKFVNPIDLTIMAYADVKINPEDSHMIQNLTLYSDYAMGNLVFDSLNLISCSVRSFSFHGQIFSEYFDSDIIGAFDSSTPYTRFYTIIDSNVTTATRKEDKLRFLQGTLFVEFEIGSPDLVILNISDSPSLIIAILSPLPLNINLKNSTASFTNASLMSIGMGTENIHSLTQFSLDNSRLNYQSTFDVGLHFGKLQNCIIENMLGFHVILRDSVDITKNVTFIPSFVEFLGDKTVSATTMGDQSFHKYSHLAVETCYFKFFEAEKLTVEKGSYIISFNSFFHAFDRINITLKVGLDGAPIMCILKSQGIGPRLNVEADAEFIHQLLDNETREYLQYGLPLGNILVGEKFVSVSDWLVDSVLSGSAGEESHTDEFKISIVRSNESLIEYIELYPDDVINFNENDFAFSIKNWVIESSIVLSIVFISLVIAGGFVLCNRYKRRPYEEAKLFTD